MIYQSEQQSKITMNFLYKRNNRNKHFQVIKDDGWLGLNHVYTGLGLYNSIHECARLSLMKYDKEFRDAPENRQFLLEEQMRFQEELCSHVMVGKNNSARKNKFGEVMVAAGWYNSP
jgi:hypothetical protein